MEDIIVIGVLLVAGLCMTLEFGLTTGAMLAIMAGTTAASAGTQFILAKKQNKAAAEAASIEAQQTARKAIDDRVNRTRLFEQYSGALRSASSSASSISSGPTSVNVQADLNKAAADATLDVGVIDDEFRNRLASLSARLKAQTSSPFLAAVQGGLEGFRFGMQTVNFASSLKFKPPKAP